MSCVVVLVPGQPKCPVPRAGTNLSLEASLSAFELLPSTSYSTGSAEQGWSCPGLLVSPSSKRRKGSSYSTGSIEQGWSCPSLLVSHSSKRRKRRPLHFASATTFQQNAHACFAALHADVRRRVRHQMMGWPADARRFLAGAFAGAVSKTVTAPLESVRMQIMTGNKDSVLHIVAHTYHKGGVLAFFSGNEADVLRTMPSKAIELASFDLYKKVLGAALSGGRKRDHPGGLATGLAGALAGITSTLAMFPLETVRTRLAVDHDKYRGVLTAFRTILAAEGFPALYRGLGASILGAIPYTAIRLGSYDGMKYTYKKMTKEETVPHHLTAIFGAVAAVASSSASFPLEVVRRRAMMGTSPAHGTIAALMAIARTEGVGALYAGVWLTWLKQAPQYAVTFLCYDLAKAWLAAENGDDKHQSTKNGSTSKEALAASRQPHVAAQGAA